VDRGNAPLSDSRWDRLGSWHSYRFLSLYGIVVCFAVVPWTHLPTSGLDEVSAVVLVVGLGWAIPCWRLGVVADGRGVRLDFGVASRRLEWEDIAEAVVGRRGLEPHLRLTLVDGRELWAPGFTVPLSERSSRADGWRSTEMFRAAELITAEAERRRRQVPPDGTLVPRPFVTEPAFARN
jgi:hypothetical protein